MLICDTKINKPFNQLISPHIEGAKIKKSRETDSIRRYSALRALISPVIITVCCAKLAKSRIL